MVMIVKYGDNKILNDITGIENQLVILHWQWVVCSMFEPKKRTKHKYNGVHGRNKVTYATFINNNATLI